MGGLFCGTSAAAQASSVMARIVELSGAPARRLPARRLLVHYIAVKLADSSCGCPKTLQRVSPFSGVPGEALPPGAAVAALSPLGDCRQPNWRREPAQRVSSTAGVHEAVLRPLQPAKPGKKRNSVAGER